MIQFGAQVSVKPPIITWNKRMNKIPNIVQKSFLGGVCIKETAELISNSVCAFAAARIDIVYFTGRL